MKTMPIDYKNDGDDNFSFVRKKSKPTEKKPDPTRRHKRGPKLTAKRVDDVSCINKSCKYFKRSRRIVLVEKFATSQYVKCRGCGKRFSDTYLNKTGISGAVQKQLKYRKTPFSKIAKIVTRLATGKSSIRKCSSEFDISKDTIRVWIKIMADMPKYFEKELQKHNVPLMKIDGFWEYIHKKTSIKK